MVTQKKEQHFLRHRRYASSTDKDLQDAIERFDAQKGIKRLDPQDNTNLGDTFNNSNRNHSRKSILNRFKAALKTHNRVNVSSYPNAKTISNYAGMLRSDGWDIETIKSNGVAVAYLLRQP